MTRCMEAPKKETGPEAGHLDSVHSVTLAYPQIVSIKSMENFLGQSADPTLKALAMESLREAAHSKSATVAELAASTLNRINSNAF